MLIGNLFKMVVKQKLDYNMLLLLGRFTNMLFHCSIGGTTTNLLHGHDHHIHHLLALLNSIMWIYLNHLH